MDRIDHQTANLDEEFRKSIGDNLLPGDDSKINGGLPILYICTTMLSLLRIRSLNLNYEKPCITKHMFVIVTFIIIAGAVDVATTNKRKHRGLTISSKMLGTYMESGRKKISLQFNDEGVPIGKSAKQFALFMDGLLRREFRHLLGDWKIVPNKVKDKLWNKITQYREIDESKKFYVMRRLGELLPDIKSSPFPRQFCTFIALPDWDKFVEVRDAEDFKVLSNKQRQAREMYKYPHNLGRKGYAAMREKIIKSNELGEDKNQERSVLLRKAREEKYGQLKTQDMKDGVEKIGERERENGKGLIKLEPNTHALSLVLGKKSYGLLKGVSRGIYASKRWKRRNLSRARVLTKSRFAQLEELQLNQLNVISDQIGSHFTSIIKGVPQDHTTDLPPFETLLSSIHESSTEVSPQSVLESLGSNTANSATKVPQTPSLVQEPNHSLETVVTSHSDSTVDRASIVTTKVINAVREPPKKKVKQNITKSDCFERCSRKIMIITKSTTKQCKPSLYNFSSDKQKRAKDNQEHLY
ncbi:hypothetical protein OROMI_017440 [Orobanche minor]